MSELERATLKIIGMLANANEHVDDEILATELLKMIGSYEYGLCQDDVAEIKELLNVYL